MSSKEEDTTPIPDIIYDNGSSTTFKKGRFFGKGGFAKCYEIVNVASNETFAGKIVSKKLAVKQNQKEKITQEIHIHQSLKHNNVVGFHGFFEDQFNIYIVLELCRKRSMMELHKRRKVLTEPETRFYMRQIIAGVQYLHEKRIIHRDLKLGNLFLDDNLHVKIGDFGLAAAIEYDGERKKTMCGTPNYIAPEILHKKGHSFEVDIWSIGCIMYTLLIGRPPFETSSLRETYSRIKKCDYKISARISPASKAMIVATLQSDPQRRPKINRLSTHEFLVDGYCPPTLPVSSLTMAPRFDKQQLEMAQQRKPLSTFNNGGVFLNKENGKLLEESITVCFAGGNNLQVFDPWGNLHALKNMIGKVLQVKPSKNHVFLDDMTDPEAQPTIWVAKWVDYSDKYGFGYQLSDEGVGVMFNDTTKVILLPNGINVHYVDKDAHESYMTIENYPREHEKKIKLLSYFSRYMREHLIMTGASVVREADSMSRTPHLHQWCRSTSGVLMQLNNGTVQMNFSDHTKIIMCPLMGAITYIDEEKQFRTFRFHSLEKYGYSVGLYDKMRYAFDKIKTLLDNAEIHP